MEKVLMGTLKKGDKFIHGNVVFEVIHEAGEKRGMFTCLIYGHEAGVHMAPTTHVAPIK